MTLARALEGKAILISGASSGIGAVCARICAREGAIVGVGYASGRDRAEALARELGGAATALELDVTRPETVSAAVEAFGARAGKIDGLVNSAGINIGGPLISLKPEEIRKQIEVNLTGAITLTQAALQKMISKRSGSIVHLGSVSAHRMIRGHSVYSATKAGIEGLTQALAAEVAKRSVRVNCVIPGPVLTPMLQKSIDETGDDPAQRVPLGRLITGEEVAEVVCFLLSDRASGITGALLPVDGGYLL